MSYRQLNEELQKKTLVFQSFREKGVPSWLSFCMDGVKDWAKSRGWDYQRIGDEILDLVPNDYREKSLGEIHLMVDLVRLI